MDEQTKKSDVKVIKVEKDPSLSPYKVLIIDDDMWIQRIFSKYLVEWGFRPISAYDPYEGVAMAVKHQPLMIFLDIIMPDVQGEVLLKMLKAIDITSEIPINIISGNFSKELLSDTYKHGAVGFLSKPFSQLVIYNALRKHLPLEVINDLESKSFKIIE
jgi:two-component system, NtrC family, sensor kinase